MEIRQLRYFVAVVECGSLSRAAGILHVVQSALSQQMMQLEQDLGASLLLRSVRGVQVTEAGNVLYGHAQAILKQLDNARVSVSAVTDVVHGPVAVGIPNSTAAVMAVALLARIRRENPQVRLSIVEGPSGQLAPLLASGGLDFSFLYQTNLLHGFETRPLLSEPLYLLAKDMADIPAFDAAPGSIALETVARMPLIIPGRRNATRILLEEACKQRGLELQVVAEIASLDTLKAGVAAGVGNTVLSAANISKLNDMSDAIGPAFVIEPRIERQILMARSRDFPRTQAADLTYELAREICCDLVLGGRWPGARLLSEATA